MSTPSDSNQCSDISLTIENGATPDISALVRENADLRRQIQILESVPDLIVAFDVTGRIFFVSQSVLEFFGLAKEEDIEGTLFWEHVTENSKVLIQKAFKDALSNEADEDDGFMPLANGRPLLISSIVKIKKGRQESRLVSLKGTIRTSEDVPECVCTMRRFIDPNQLKHIISCPEVSQISDNEEPSQKTTGGENKKDAVSFKRIKAEVSWSNQTATKGEKKNGAVSSKRAKADDYLLNQVSD